MAPVEGEAAADTPKQQNEKKLLKSLVKVEKLKLDISQRERREERVIPAVRQLSFEDIPFTVMNLLYVVYGCGQGGTTGVQAMFLFSTVLSVVFGSKKYFEWKQVQADRTNVEWWVEIVAMKLAASKELLKEIRGGIWRRRGGARVVPLIGGEEIKAVEGWRHAQKIARLEREKKALLEEKGTAERREKATREEFEVFKKNV